MNIEFVNILDVNDDLIEQVRIWRNSKQVSQYMYTNHPISKEEHLNWLEKLKTSDSGKAWIIKYDQKSIGLAQLSNIDYINKTTEWGFYIADASIRGKGVGSAVLYKLIEHVFFEMKFDKMRTLVLTNNPVAISLYKKFGFIKEGKLEQKLKRNGKLIDVFIMSLSKENCQLNKSNIK
jgi:UDP-4-amino-4,6-dideoxy-N-acetyl-beta-L-altrosamine N-acetyltransferase